MTKEEKITNVGVGSKTNEELDEFRERFGMRKRAIVERMTRWLSDQDREVQAIVLRLLPPLASADLLHRMADAFEGAISSSDGRSKAKSRARKGLHRSRPPVPPGPQ